MDEVAMRASFQGNLWYRKSLTGPHTNLAVSFLVFSSRRDCAAFLQVRVTSKLKQMKATGEEPGSSPLHSCRLNGTSAAAENELAR